MTEQEIHDEIFRIIEVDMLNRELGAVQLNALNERLKELLQAYPDGQGKRRTIAKIRDKQRFCYYINDTGILDFTGYGGNFW